jgi:hypothetical protein
MMLAQDASGAQPEAIHNYERALALLGPSPAGPAPGVGSAVERKLAMNICCQVLTSPHHLISW